MNNDAIAMVLRYMDECLFEPCRHWSRYDFDKRSYSRWAANEIVELLMADPFTSADRIMDEFIIKMCYFAHLAKENNQRFIFAIDTAEDILSIVM